MAKNALPVKTGGMLGKLIGALVALAVLTLVVKHPSDAADWVTGLFHMLGRAIDGISAFLHDVLG